MTEKLFTGTLRTNQPTNQLLDCPAVREKYQGFVLYRQKRQCNENRGKRRWFYQLAVPAVWGFWQRFAGQKVKVPAIPWGAVVTNDWCTIYIRGFSSAKLKQPLFYIANKNAVTIEPCYEKTCLWSFRPGQTQTRLYNHRIWLVA